ncbi:ring-cleaving dioxygenase [soil metagenome]
MVARGIHHVTAFCSSPQDNVDFYTLALGLRLVKRTVNFDDPTTYHLYYGNADAAPGSILTFFPWPDAARGRIGAGQVIATAYAIPDGSLEVWAERLAELGTGSGAVTKRFDEQVLALSDVDGLPLELVESTVMKNAQPWSTSDVGTDIAPRAFHSVTLASVAPRETERVLQAVLGMSQIGMEDDRCRFAFAVGDDSAVDVIRHERDSRTGTGTVHHVAFRVPDEAAQAKIGRAAGEAGLYVTPVRDRKYFRSIYFREPGGILFEVATDGPGFFIDETDESLGTDLCLPDKYEHLRPTLEQRLPPLETSRSFQPRP